MSTGYERIAEELGRQAAANGMQKEAFLSELWQGGKAMLGGLGGGLLKGIGAVSPRAGQWATQAFANKGIPSQMLQFGAIGGGLGALTNSDDRLGGFARGFASGALGGLGWGVGQEGVRAGLKSLGTRFAPKTYGALTSRAEQKLFRSLTPAEEIAKQQGSKVPGLWSRRQFGSGRAMGWSDVAKTLGSRAALGAGPLAGGFAGASLMEQLGPMAESEQPTQDIPQQPAQGMWPYGSNY